MKCGWDYSFPVTQRRLASPPAAAGVKGREALTRLLSSCGGGAVRGKLGKCSASVCLCKVNAPLHRLSSSAHTQRNHWTRCSCVCVSLCLCLSFLLFFSPLPNNFPPYYNPLFPYDFCTSFFVSICLFFSRFCLYFPFFSYPFPVFFFPICQLLSVAFFPPLSNFSLSRVYFLFSPIPPLLLFSFFLNTFSLYVCVTSPLLFLWIIPFPNDFLPFLSIS